MKQNIGILSYNWYVSSHENLNYHKIFEEKVKKIGIAIENT